MPGTHLDSGDMEVSKESKIPAPLMLLVRVHIINLIHTFYRTLEVSVMKSDNRRVKVLKRAGRCPASNKRVGVGLSEQTGNC